MRSDHPFFPTLNAIEHFLVSASGIMRFPSYRVYGIYAYLRALVIIIGSISLSTPLAVAIRGGDQSNSPAVTVGQFFTAIPGPIRPLALAVGLCVLLLLTYVQVTDLEKKVNLARSCQRQALSLEVTNLERILEEPNPLPKLIELRNTIAALHSMHINEGSWPWAGNAHAPGIEAEVTRRLQKLYASHSPQWRLPAGEQIEVAGPLRNAA